MAAVQLDAAIPTTEVGIAPQRCVSADICVGCAVQS